MTILRNHGYILIPGKGWRLSEAYDLNPVARSDGLKLNITENDNALDLELAREVAEYFRLGLTEADDIIAILEGLSVSGESLPSVFDYLVVSKS